MTDNRCEVCKRRPGLPCCKTHSIRLCQVCYEIITERILVPTLDTMTARMVATKHTHD